MAIDTSLLTDYSFAQIKLAMKHAIMTAGVGGVTLSIGGRTIGRCTLKEAWDIYTKASMAEALEGDANGGIILGSFGEPQ